MWLARLHAETSTGDDEAAFRLWLAEDPANAAAFERATGCWDAAGGLRRLDLVREVPARPLISRRRLLETAAATVMLGIGLGIWRNARAGIYETGLGEQQRVTLDDGTAVLLDTDTRIRVHMDDVARTVSLERGRVNCRVAEDAKRPFVVDAGGERILASATTLDVRRDVEQVSVICLQGNAVVDAAASAPQTLSAGQRLKTSSSRPAMVDRPELTPLVAWQNGQAIFDNTALGDAIREMNRYSRIKLELADPHLAGLRVSGVYRVGDAGAFAESVASLLPLVVLRDDGQIRLGADPARKPAKGG